MTLKQALLATAFAATPALVPGLALAQAAAPAVAAQAAATAANPTDQGGEVSAVVVTGKFIDTGAYSGTKLNIPVIDTPLSVSAYTRSFMNSVEVTNVADLYKYMTGVQRAGNTGYDITMRGFKTLATDRNAIMTDGLPGLTVRFGSPPTIGTDHVEIVKGPASILYGEAQPGGFVNIITKKPRDERETEVEARGDFGLSDFHRQVGGLLDLDTTGPIMPGKLDYRFIAEVGDLRGWRRFDYDKPYYFAPSVTWNLDDATRATLLTEWRYEKTHYDSYLIAPHDNIDLVAPIDTTYQEKGDYQWEQGATATVLASHDFSNDLTLNVNYRYVQHRDVAHGWDVVSLSKDQLSVNRRARGQDNSRTYSFVDANFVGKFDVAGISNKMVFGVQYGRETSDFNRLQFYNAPATGPLSATMSIYNPVYGAVGPLWSYPAVNPNTPQNLNDRFTSSIASGVYVSDFITFTDQIKALVGLRYAKETQHTHEEKLQGVPDNDSSGDDWLPMVGLTYEPTEHLSLYATYSTSFTPVAASTQDINGNFTFTPTTANSIEGGVKSQMFDHRLTLTAAIFDIKKQNVIDTFACSFGTCAEQQGEEESKGEELEINANPLRNWQIAAGLSNVDARVVKSNDPVTVGARLTNVSKVNAHMWSRYDFVEGPLHGLGIGLGVAYNSKFYGLLPTSKNADTLPIPGYTTVDLAGYYKIKNVELTLKVSNLFDKTYFESVGSQGALAVLPGQPRTATLTVRALF